MDNVKLHRLPAAMMALLMTTALVLGLSTAACNESHTEDGDIVNKLVLTIPINDGEQETDTCAPETVKYYQICGFDKNGDSTYSEQFARNNSNTKDNVTSLTLRKARDSKGGIVGITYGTKTILINYLDNGSEFLGYTLLTGLDLSSNAYKEIIVDKVFMAGLAKQTDALGLDLSSNIQTSENTAKEDVAEETEATEASCEAVVDDTVNIIVKLNAKTNPGVTDDFITLDMTDTSLINYSITSQTKDDEQNEDDVIKETEYPGTYRCISAGTAVIDATYSSLKADNNYEIIVVDHDITGTVYVTIDDAFAAGFESEICYAQLKGRSEKVPVTNNMFTLNDMYTSYHNKAVTFYDADENELGVGALPAFKITVNGDTANVTISDAGN